MMTTPRHISRRLVLGGGSSLLTTFALTGPAGAAGLAAEDFGFSADGGEQSAALQEALDAASAKGLPLRLPPGRFRVSDIVLPPATTLIGAGAGRTTLVSPSSGPALRASGAARISLTGFRLDGDGPIEDRAGLLSLTDCTDMNIADIEIGSADGNGIFLEGCSGWLERLVIAGCGTSAILALNSAGLTIDRCRIIQCGNSGIRIWRDNDGEDGSVISNSRISDIDWRGGGNGQNGNGINLYRADGVIVAGNAIANCAFTAIRLNATRNCIVSDNICRASGEVAIFSEFGFSGSVIADNIVDGAATGISVTNFDSGGRLATVSGNIVRNITPASAVNPDTVPTGIQVEADTTVSGNVVEAVPGIGILAGFGQFMRNLVVTGNLIRDAEIGIGISVVTDGTTGSALISDNFVAGAGSSGIAGMAWRTVVSDDLARDAARYPHLGLWDNRSVAI